MTKGKDKERARKTKHEMDKALGPPTSQNHSHLHQGDRMLGSLGWRSRGVMTATYTDLIKLVTSRALEVDSMFTLGIRAVTWTPMIEEVTQTLPSRLEILKALAQRLAVGYILTFQEC